MICDDDRLLVLSYLRMRSNVTAAVIMMKRNSGRYHDDSSGHWSTTPSSIAAAYRVYSASCLT
jgi:hypothetical protein